MTKESIRTVLLVEDNPADARSLREMGSTRGGRTKKLTHVKRLTEAETYLAQHSVEIILLDLGLPDAQGLEALRRVRAAAPRVPLVVLTGLEDESVTEAALQEGAQGCLIKGQIDTPGLLRALRHAIDRKFMEDALFEQKERAQVTLNSIGDAVICTDIKGNITFLNVVAETMTAGRGKRRQAAPWPKSCKSATPRPARPSPIRWPWPSSMAEP
jgi:DNA-binding NarL/FixJ family response regulator